MPAPQPAVDPANDTPSARARVGRFWSTNPFFVLGANPRDQRRRIVELAEELSLEGNPETISKARADLTHPRARLGAEMAWLPGVSPKRATECVKAAVATPQQTDAFNSLPSLAHANLLAVAFDAIDANGGRSAPCSLESFAAVVESIDVAEVRRHINEDRSISGFPEITNSDWIESELADRRRVYRASVRSWMERSETRLMLGNLIASVERATGEGRSHPPLLIEEVVADYELGAQPALAKAVDAVNQLLEHGRAVATKGAADLTSIIVEIERFMREWDHLARPQQLCAKARGEEHGPSVELAARVRNLGVDLANKHELYDAANRITWLLREVFSEVPSVVEKVEIDAAAVKNLLEQQKKAAADKETFEEGITYNADIGMLFKTRLAISPEGVQWGNLHFPLDSITRLRWGGVKHSINFIPTGTDYHILFGDDSRFAKFSLSKKKVYEDFNSKLWRAVGHRIIFRYAQGLRAGKTFRFGDIVVSDDGCEISKPKFFGAERIKAPWSDLQIWSSNGNLVVGVKTNHKISSSASYKNNDNTHLLDSMIRAFFKDAAAKRLSDAFLE
jgi:hypothetical protein